MEVKDVKDMNDEEMKALVEYSERPELQPELKHEAKCYLNTLIKDGYCKDNDATKLRWALLKILKEYPMMATYTKYILDEAKERGFTFKDDVEKWK